MATISGQLLEDADEAPLPPRRAILPGYHRGSLPRRRMLLLFGALFGAAMLLGLLVAYLPAARLSLLTIPVVVLGLLIVWVLPQGASPPVRSMETIFFAYFVALTLWPYYLAFDVPGFPLIEVRRTLIAGAILLLMINFSISAAFRERMHQIVATSSLLFKLYAVFVVAQIISIPLSRDPPASISVFVRDQLGWTGVLLISAYVFSRPGRINVWTALFRSLAIFIAFLAFAEFRNKGILWANHIPWFLRIDDSVTERILTPLFRGTAYRVTGTFPVSLSLAEWLALTMPFLLYQIAYGRRLLPRLICIVADVMVFVAIVLTQARIGLVGTLVGHGIFVAVWALRSRRSNPGLSLIPTAVLAAYPVVALAAIASIPLVPALRVRILGGGTQAASNEGRLEQLQMAMPMIAQRPLNGYGVGSAAAQLGWTNDAGQPSIDSYILTLLLDYGVFGFAAFVAVISWGVVHGFRAGVASRNFEEGYAGVAAVGLCVFAACQVVLSQEDNVSLVFMLLGIICAAKWRQKHVPDDVLMSATGSVAGSGTSRAS